MCGIVAVLRRPGDRVAPELKLLVDALDEAEVSLRPYGAAPDAAGISAVAKRIAGIERALRGTSGTIALLADPVALSALEHRTASLADVVVELDTALDAYDSGTEIEALNAAVVTVKDALWALSRDRLRTARAVEQLSGGAREPRAIEAFHSVQVALSAIDRLEVRGRDSAGLHILVTGHGLDLDDPTIARLIATRHDDPLFTSGAVRVTEGQLAFVYKVAAEIGELGDNTARLRAQIAADEFLRLAVRAETAEAVVLAHTRWASVGIISEANAHPLNQEELGGDGEGSYVVAALNGDVDNYADLKALEALRFPAEITTDAKVIPALVSRRIASGTETIEAFRATVAAFEGSVAIGAQVAAEPGRVLLAQRGSGQALYVGVADDAYVVASEPYGVVEQCDRYLRLDGETMLVPGEPGTQGQIVAVSGAHGMERWSYDGSPLPVADSELKQPEITTRDVDRGDAPHYLLKEIYEAPASFHKTLRGHILDEGGQLEVRLAPEALPPAVVDRLRRGAVQRIIVTGQGTAAIAGQGVALALRRYLAGRPITVEAAAATELSGFGLARDMSDALVITISQSGTTADTNRTVDLVRARGAAVISIVNRRQSDLVDKSDGVLFTSDGRDLEMSVASTKAFYAQIAAGFLLAFAIASELGVGPEPDAERAARQKILAALRELPAAMREVLERRPAIALAAQRHALSRRSWAVVGNGINRVAAEEIRIKLSELCYKSISCDITEDKKHIDLSAEPMIIVCAAGLHGSNADDVSKEIAIYRAHKSAPIVIADDGEARFLAALETLTVPVVHPDVSFVLCAMVGHLFGYEAALAIDATARPLREARGCIEALIGTSREGDDLLHALAVEVQPHADRFFDGLRTSSYDGALDAGTAVRLASLLRYATGVVPLDVYQVEFGKVGTPSTVIEDLTSALTKAIEELTRPIDAIKHQAKTVTVGISRSDETLLQVPLVQELLATGAARDSLTYRALRTMVALDPAIDVVAGWTRYRIDGDPSRPGATIEVVDTGGIARDIPSRTVDNPTLRGTKHRAASEREVTVVRGRADGRTLVIVPEIKANQTTGLTLLHVRFHDRLPAAAARRVLEGYRDRYEAIADQVTELEPVMRDDVLATIDLVELLTEPVVRLADRWKSSERS
jgi:glucosamine--fructose-6-phosphate aminotransferase (isomerizing)